MKRINYFLVVIAALSLTAACNSVNYKKTKSGLLYKIIPSDSKDSIATEGNWLKIHYVQKINDSLLQSTYGKMPLYQKVSFVQPNEYSPSEIYHLLKKGDSAVIVILVDSILKKGLTQELPPFMKKGDRLTISLRVIDVIRDDSVYQADSRAEFEKDRPRQEKEKEEMMAKMKKERELQQQKEEEELQKSGEIAKELQEMEAWLSSKNINAQKTGKGTYVKIDQQGTGAAAQNGKWVAVKYTGKFLATDSVFQTSSYAFQLGEGQAIPGWDEGLLLFKQGGKGTLYITGFKAYGKNPPPGSPFKPFEPLKFDIELLNVSDTALKQSYQ